MIMHIRRLQQPYDALAHWGDPPRVDGVMNPRMNHCRGIGETGSCVELTYGPPALGPCRLLEAELTLLYGDERPPYHQEAVRDWLGEPVEEMMRSKGQPVQVTWTYQGTDSATVGE